jgi:hypothetical protein
MSEDMNMAERVINYFECEFQTIQKDLEDGSLLDYKERVIVSNKIDDALSKLSPYVRCEWKARQVVKSGESLRERLLSVKDIITNPPIS